jgi:hypothetical protein
MIIGKYPKLPEEYNHEVSAQRIPGARTYRKFGLVESTTASTETTVWEYGSNAGARLYTFSTGPAIDTISSSDPAVNQLFLIDGLNGDWERVTQFVTLNGQNKVLLDTPLIRVNRVANANGTPIPIAAEVFLYEDHNITNGVPNTPSLVRAYVTGKHQGTMQAVYSTAVNERTYLKTLSTGLIGKRGGTTQFLGKVNDGQRVPLTQLAFDIYSGGDSYITEPLILTEFLDPMSDVYGNIISDSNGSGASLSYIMLIENI